MATGFTYVEGSSTVGNIVGSLAAVFVSAGWTKEYPTGAVTNYVILKTVTSFEKTFYLAITQPEDKLNHIKLQIGTETPTGEGNGVLADGSSQMAKLSWYKENETLHIGKWLPIQYWVSASKDFINIVVQGDPSVDVSPYNNYLISYAYIGALEGFVGADEDKDYNFALTSGSDTAPVYANTYGQRTGAGITDIIMVGTRTGTPYQAHTPSYNCEGIHIDKNYIGASNWTHKYHASKCTICHAYDRERGYLQNMLIMDRSATFHLDEFKESTDGGEKVYKFFNLRAPYSFLNNGANPLYGIAIRKS